MAELAKHKKTREEHGERMKVKWKAQKATVCSRNAELKAKTDAAEAEEGKRERRRWEVLRMIEEERKAMRRRKEEESGSASPCIMRASLRGGPTNGASRDRRPVTAGP